MNGSSEAVIPPALPSVAVLLVSEHTNNNQQGDISTSQGLFSLHNYIILLNKKSLIKLFSPKQSQFSVLIASI